MAILFYFSPTSSHLHPLQVENCGSNLRLVVDEMTMVNSGSKGLKLCSATLKNFYMKGRIIGPEPSGFVYCVYIGQLLCIYCRSGDIREVLIFINFPMTMSRI